MAIVSDIPGTTRDRRQGHGMLAGIPLHVVDTGGLDDEGVVSGEIVEQVEMAVAAADVVLFLVDARAGLTPLDAYYAQWLRKTLGKLSSQARRSNSLIFSETQRPRERDERERER
eukprot:CAMPEP_0182432200 /NCGR_PEP_ID=MMETSP1167-20130531/54804_1 /TAXON_ID=2988 /ORGANISM="Mallomonas Sp, Strain CCMP3275" /LENGTH=114 /DNA_ID=CAMNT_0024619425 /DNA_START=158 /DNA_END=499 /DNA_ORIENTATION=+